MSLRPSIRLPRLRLRLLSNSPKFLRWGTVRFHNFPPLFSLVFVISFRGRILIVDDDDLSGLVAVNLRPWWSLSFSPGFCALELFLFNPRVSSLSFSSSFNFLVCELLLILREFCAMEPRVGNKFKLGRKIGSGSFGEIYLGLLFSGVVLFFFFFCVFFFSNLILVFFFSISGTNIQTNEEVAIKLVSKFCGFVSFCGCRWKFIGMLDNMPSIVFDLIITSSYNLFFFRVIGMHMYLTRVVYALNTCELVVLKFETGHKLIPQFQLRP